MLFYDCPASATRLVQRMGRTGRHDTGHVCVLNEGVEEKKYLAAEKEQKELQVRHYDAYDNAYDAYDNVSDAYDNAYDASDNAYHDE